jgi:hypothetical protein
MSFISVGEDGASKVDHPKPTIAVTQFRFAINFAAVYYKDLYVNIIYIPVCHHFCRCQLLQL